MQITNKYQQVFINGKQYKGLYMGEKFIDTLFAPLETKEVITSESRLENGRRVIIPPTRFKWREFNLTFQMHGDTPQEYFDLKAGIEEIFYNGYFELQVPKRSNVVFVLRAVGSAYTYAENTSRMMGTMTVKMAEDNIDNRHNA